MSIENTNMTEEQPSTLTASPSHLPEATKQASDKNASAHGSSPWTFLTNHAHVLIVLHSEPNLVLREVALQVGITERAVQRIVQELEEEGFLTRERVGRRNHYQINTDRHLRHPVESHCTIDQVISLINNTRSAYELD